MDIRKLTEGLSVAGQIDPADMPEIAALGIRAVISNRPDGEAAGQPAFAEIESAARATGLEARHLPVTAPIADADATAFGEMLDILPGPVLAFCRTGTRSASLWALLCRDGDGEDLIARAAAAGCDLSSLKPRLLDA
jgi:sulfide:quinone oxidoreductase